MKEGGIIQKFLQENYSDQKLMELLTATEEKQLDPMSVNTCLFF
jgi:hypothetical protein